MYLIMHVAVRSMQAKLVGWLHFSSLDRWQIADYDGQSGHGPGTDSDEKGSKKGQKSEGPCPMSYSLTWRLFYFLMQQSAEELRCMTSLQSPVSSLHWTRVLWSALKQTMKHPCSLLEVIEQSSLDAFYMRCDHSDFFFVFFFFFFLFFMWATRLQIKCQRLGTTRLRESACLKG